MLEEDRARVRLAPGRYAVGRYRGLRPADPAATAFEHPESSTLLHVTPGRDGGWRRRSLRVDEALAILDAQLAIDDVHPIDRQKFSLLRFAYHCDRQLLTKGVGVGAFELRMVVSQQRWGERYWWACPTCGRRCRYLYHYLVGRRLPALDVVGCRVCLGLTYASCSRHRCRDQDRVRAARGDVVAAERLRQRAERSAKRAELERQAYEAFRTRMQRRITAVAQELGYGRPWGA